MNNAGDGVSTGERILKMGQPKQLRQYQIEETLNLDARPCFVDPSTYPSFQEDYTRFKEFVADSVRNRVALSVYKFGWGDYLFLTRQSEGSARVGFRALSKPYESIGHEEFVDGASKCDSYLCELDRTHTARFREVIRRRIDFPAEYAYAVVANRWLFRSFAGQIGLIGASEKIRLIRRLMELPEYREYLGLERFEDYITIPQQFACDDLKETERQAAMQLRTAKSQIFLVGVGHVKSGLLHRLKNYARSVFLDVGQGIDALAGIIDIEKPYFGGWKNYRVEEPGLYEGIDYLSYLPYSFVNPDAE